MPHRYRIPDCRSVNQNNSGNTSVPSLLTASRSFGSLSRARRIVGATCVVLTGAFTVRVDFTNGATTRRATAVSSAVAPPCSAIFLLLPE